MTSDHDSRDWSGTRVLERRRGTVSVRSGGPGVVYEQDRPSFRGTHRNVLAPIEFARTHLEPRAMQCRLVAAPRRPHELPDDPPQRVVAVTLPVTGPHGRYAVESGRPRGVSEPA